MGEETPSQRYRRETKQRAKEAFENHVIKARGDGRWVISKQYDDGAWCNFYLSEIIVGICGTVIVHGDISPVLFGHYGKYEDPLEAVHWIARSGVDRYLQSKAHIGLVAPCGADLTKRFVPDVAVWEMRGHIEDRIQELEDDPDNGTSIDIEHVDETNDAEIAAWRRAIRALNGGDAWEMVRFQLHEDLEDAGCCDVGEMIWDIGQMPAQRIYYAQAACQKLLELLEQEEKEPERTLKVVEG